LPTAVIAIQSGAVEATGQAVGDEAESAQQADPNAVAGDTGEGSSRRRRGRRGGRRRRRGGAEGEGAEGVPGEMSSDDDVLLGDEDEVAGVGETAIHVAHRSQPEFDFDDEHPAAHKPAAGVTQPAVAATAEVAVRRPAFEPRPPLADDDEAGLATSIPAAPRHGTPTPADDAARAIAGVDATHPQVESVAVIEDSVIEPALVPAPVVVDEAAIDATPVEIAPLLASETAAIEPAPAAVEPATAAPAVESTNSVVPHTASLFDSVPQTREPESTEPKVDDGPDDDTERRA